jgi:hypothetical protein
VQALVHLENIDGLTKLVAWEVPPQGTGAFLGRPTYGETALNTFTVDRRQKQLRAALLAFAVLLALQSIWIILPELIRPSPIAFPRDARSLPIGSSERTRAARAAKLAVIRGDLWAEAAIAQPPELIWDVASRKVAQPTDQAHTALTVAEKAATLSPHDSRIWLYLASLDCLLHREVSGALNMSYYTGSNQIALMPLRLLVATCSDAINDGELQILAARDIRLIITEQDLKPAILAAYQNGSPSGKGFIDSVVSELDPALMATIRIGQKTDK